MIVSYFALSGFESFSLTGSADINTDDSYFVIPNLYIFISMSTIIFFGIYLTRMLRRNFKNLTANLIFIISNISLILIFTYLISSVNSLKKAQNTLEYPELSGETFENVTNRWNSNYDNLLIIQLILIVLLIISGIKTGLNFKRRNKNTMHNNV